ncbi:MAG TPA: iron ABC transporter permease [Pyrinomonadaceae bacterium]|nr:iron ABC transporter permease [Pyrinomonadaceae bacterium]
MNSRRKIALFLGGVLVVSLVLAVLFGSERLNFVDLTAEQRVILFDIRIPRIFLAASVGAALAAAGAALQSLLRNPLAEPYLLGVSNGAALGTMLAFVFFGSIEFSRPVLAFVGAGAATFAVYKIAQSRAGMNVERLVLSGVIVTTFLSSIIVLLTSLLDAAKLRSFMFWLLGDLSQATMYGVYLAAAVSVVGITVLYSQAKALNLMMIGERDAFDLGVEVARVRLIVFVSVSALIGATVAASGSVGYVGLIVPHLVRLASGSDNRTVIPFSAVAGASFVVLADLAARTAIAPRELPVGAVTALIGAPLFIYLLRKA